MAAENHRAMDAAASEYQKLFPEGCSPDDLDAAHTAALTAALEAFHKQVRAVAASGFKINSTALTLFSSWSSHERSSQLASTPYME